VAWSFLFRGYGITRNATSASFATAFPISPCSLTQYAQVGSDGRSPSLRDGLPTRMAFLIESRRHPAVEVLIPQAGEVRHVGKRMNCPLKKYFQGIVQVDRVTFYVRATSTSRAGERPCTTPTTLSATFRGPFPPPPS